MIINPVNSTRTTSLHAPPRSITGVLSLLRTEWPHLVSKHSWNEMASIIQFLTSRCRSSIPTELLDQVLEAVTRYYLEDDGRTLQQKGSRLVGLERSILDVLPSYSQRQRA